MARSNASSERSSDKEILSDFVQFNQDGFFLTMLNAFPSFVAIINENRQLVYANDALNSAFNVSEIEGILGSKPGELLNCINVDMKTGGCGASVGCVHCGAFNSILEAQKTVRKSEKECRVSIMKGDQLMSFEFKVTTTPFEHKGKQFYFFILDDISALKRGKILERVFFHDVINTVTSLKSTIKMLYKKLDGKEENKEVAILQNLADELIDEILQQRDISIAETAEIKLKPVVLSASKLIQQSVDFIKHHRVAQGRTIEISKCPFEDFILTDNSLLHRVICNMLKNALEAIPENESVYIGCAMEKDRVKIWVRNGSVMPPEIKEQIFSRTFSTKGEYRGLGTYSMKLFGENYLKGEVGFESVEENGTTFYICLPVFKDI